MLSDWIVANKKNHPGKVNGSIFKLNKDKQVVARILGPFTATIHGQNIGLKKDNGVSRNYFLGFVCGTNYFGDLSESYSDSHWETKDEFLEVVAIKVDLKLLSMDYKIKSIGKFE